MTLLETFNHRLLQFHERNGGGAEVHQWKRDISRSAVNAVKSTSYFPARRAPGSTPAFGERGSDEPGLLIIGQQRKQYPL